MTTFITNRNNKKTVDSSVTEYSKTKNKFKNFLIICLSSIIVLTTTFFIGYSNGVKHQKDKSIEDIKYTLSADYELDDWQILQMAIAKTESEYNQYAVGTSNDCGIFQITPIYVREVNRIADTHYQITDAFDIKKSIEMFSIVQRHQNPEYDIDKAIHLHNPGGASVKYFDRVYDNIIFIKRLESVRKEVLLNNYYVSNNIIVNNNILGEFKDTVDNLHSKKIKETTLSSTPAEKIKTK